MLSQEARILQLLRANRVHGVPNYVFPRHNILRYSSRICELRKDGHNILAQRQVINGRFTGVWHYFLIEDKPTLVSRLKSKIA